MMTMGLALAWAALGAPDAPRARAGFYQLVDLGTLDGGRFSSGSSVNFAGQVAGSAQRADGLTHAVRWGSGGGMTDLGTLPGGTTSQALAINVSGKVTGTSTVISQGLSTSHAFTSEGAGMEDLGTIRGGSWSAGYAINAMGQVAGAGDVGGGAMHAFVSGGGQLFDLGTLRGGTTSQANAINDSGLVAGSADTAFGATHAVKSDANGLLHDLGTLRGTSTSFATTINNLGQVAGASGGYAGLFHAFVTTTAGSMVDLGSLPGASSSFALGMNDNGQVVGRADYGSFSHGFLWDPATGMIDLNQLLTPGTPWDLSCALGINSKGQITGFGLMTRATPTGYVQDVHGFLLSPDPPPLQPPVPQGDPVNVPEPASAVLTLLGGVLAVVAARRASRTG